MTTARSGRTKVIIEAKKAGYQALPGSAYRIPLAGAQAAPDRADLRSRRRRRGMGRLPVGQPAGRPPPGDPARSEEHTSELQSLRHLVCRLLLEKKRTHQNRLSGFKALAGGQLVSMGAS